ncbi:MULTISPECIES: hypothetical protein [unclassified Rhodococcus (in: high G+C Gram-positive bacteria)]|nr:MULTISPECIES: hypothetical protein [unclassified Rhodococcus (in: high G+C Gram-positive bacteria)]MDI9951427.1 hypothetical protein [Rhodococcus sp. IEGM 1305]MDI9976757.1 hypothetical protein [Rhodococcus sp. IEGM 1307]
MRSGLQRTSRAPPPHIAALRSKIALLREEIVEPATPVPLGNASVNEPPT